MDFLTKFYQHSFYKNTIALSKKIIIDRRHKVTVYDFITELKKELSRNDILSESQGVAFSFTLALFPGIIFLFTLIPFFPIESLDQKIMVFLETNIPQKFFESTQQTIESIVEDMVVTQRTDLLSFGFLFALFAATNGMMGLINAFNKCYHTKEKRGFIKTRIIAVMLTFMFAGILFLSIFIIVFSQGIANLLEVYSYPFIYEAYLYIINLLDSFLLIIVYFILISIIYYFAPSVHKRWSFFSLGSILATAFFVLTSTLFSYYINNFATYNKLYGSIGTLIGIMLWLQIISYVILLGFEINAALDTARHNYTHHQHHQKKRKFISHKRHS